MSVAGRAHQALVYGRRVRVLARHVGELLPEAADVLDVGAGDGRIDALLLERRPDLRIRGVDVLIRPQSFIDVLPFDGRTLPLPDAAVDAVLFVDVLHHTTEPQRLLGEAARVTRRWIVLKDHLRDGLLAAPTLRFMDWFGNARHGVALPYHYWRERQWLEAFEAVALDVDVWRTSLGLYPWPASLLFERRLHFIARLSRRDRSCAPSS